MAGVIRPARPADLPVLRDVERAAGQVFRELGMAAVADDEPPAIGELVAYQADGRAWVFADAADRPVAYLLVAVVDGHAHIEQVSVHPEHARRGIGRRLVDVAGEWARAGGDPRGRGGEGAGRLATGGHAPATVSTHPVPYPLVTDRSAFWPTASVVTGNGFAGLAGV
jgi:GNAT superfamily N-acetyltransferase